MPHSSSANLIVLYILVDTKSHSYRIGGACHAAEVGYSDEQIRVLGRWNRMDLRFIVAQMYFTLS